MPQNSKELALSIAAQYSFQDLLPDVPTTEAVEGPQPYPQGAVTNHLDEGFMARLKRGEHLDFLQRTKHLGYL